MAEATARWEKKEDKVSKVGWGQTLRQVLHWNVRPACFISTLPLSTIRKTGQNCFLICKKHLRATKAMSAWRIKIPDRVGLDRRASHLATPSLPRHSVIQKEQLRAYTTEQKVAA